MRRKSSGHVLMIPADTVDQHDDFGRVERQQHDYVNIENKNAPFESFG